jgi:hypothetical protein
MDERSRHLADCCRNARHFTTALLLVVSMTIARAALPPHGQDQGVALGSHTLLTQPALWRVQDRLVQNLHGGIPSTREART